MKIQRNSNTNPTQFQHKSSTNPTLPATPRQKSNTSGNAKTRVRAGEADASTRTKTHTKRTPNTPNTHQTHQTHTTNTKPAQKTSSIFTQLRAKKYSKTTFKITHKRVENLLAKRLKVGRKMAQHPILGRNFVPAEGVAMMKHVNNGLSKEIDMALGVHAARDG